MIDEFLKGCVAGKTVNGIFKMYDEPVMYPFVEAEIAGIKISMGNDSTRTNEANIKSFNFGISNGLGVKIEIVDEAGGRFYDFFNKLGIGNKDLVDKKKLIKFRFGYISQNCSGFVQGFNATNNKPNVSVCATVTANAGNSIPRATDPIKYVSEWHELYIQDIDCQASTSNCFNFIINAMDMTVPTKSATDNRTIGSEVKRMPLVKAVKEAFEPYGIEVDFIEVDEFGTRKPLRFQPIAGSCNTPESLQFEPLQETCGPCGIWHMGNRSPMVACWEWVQTSFTNDRRSISYFWEDAKGKPRIVYCKTLRKPCAENAYQSKLVIGTYVVNGGKSSPVISFTPNFKYMVQQTLTNAAMPAGTGEQPAVNTRQKTSPHPDCLPNDIMTNVLNTGFNVMQQSMNPNAWLWWMKEASSKIRDAMTIHNYGNTAPKAMPIEAELKIIGNPAYEFPILTIGYAISIVYINPFRPKPLTGGLMDWQQPETFFGLLTQSCNPIISNCNWQIMGISHDIRDGAFYTTIKVRLAAPGVDLPPDSPLGGCPGGFEFN